MDSSLRRKWATQPVHPNLFAFFLPRRYRNLFGLFGFLGDVDNPLFGLRELIAKLCHKGHSLFVFLYQGFQPCLGRVQHADDFFQLFYFFLKAHFSFQIAIRYR